MDVEKCLFELSKKQGVVFGMFLRFLVVCFFAAQTFLGQTIQKKLKLFLKPIQSRGTIKQKTDARPNSHDILKNKNDESHTTIIRIVAMRPINADKYMGDQEPNETEYCCNVRHQQQVEKRWWMRVGCLV